ncbi:MAG: hypothetical protein DI539_24170 [Flavobacterium psychrophilum]|nr:MAG: hypothetical protein DI539_24170 [Flavobacterium psychrophilum]
MKQITLLILLFISLNIFAQKEANNWQFGLFTGIHFEDDGSVTTLTSAIESNEGCSSISDGAGNLLFYTDGRNVWDRNNVLMPNGNYNIGTGLMGDPSSTQSGVIVPKKGDPNIYYIFTVDEPHHQNAETYPNPFPGPYEDGATVPGQDDGFNNGFNYSIVDLSVTGSNGSIGDVVMRNSHLVTYDPNNSEQIKYKCSEKVTAVKNSSGSGYWVITHFVNTFYAFEVTGTGVNTTPVTTTLTPTVPVSGYRRNSIGCIKASPNGKKVAIAHVQIGTITGGTEQNGAVWLYDFDNETGKLSNPLAISQNTMPYGVEFSQKTKKLYVSYDNSIGFGGIHQYNLESSNIPASDVLLATSSQSGTLQLGPNGKIYRAVVNSHLLDVINNPDEDGTLCNYAVGGVFLDSGTCFFGLPHFITSYFAINIIASNKCFGNVTHFELDTDDDFTTVAWDFGDGQTSAASPLNTTTHTYTATGTYTVTATVTHQGEIHIETTDITITTTPTIASQPVNLEECDPNNDGITVFNLTQNDVLILGLQSAAENSIKYFDNKQNADANTNALNASAYTNTANPQRIYARIHSSINPECFEVTSFLLSTLNSPVVDETVSETICLNNPNGLTLKAVNSNPQSYTYLWITGETSPSIVIHQPGTYIVTITNQLQCSNTKTFIITASDLAVITDVKVNDMRDNNTVTIMAEPPQGVETTYVYSLDAPNGPFQESNYFENLSSGIHTVYIKDTKGCGIKAQEITVLETPKFFTPNGDGVNDTWNIIGINAYFYPNSKIYIFDRYGKLLADVDPKGIGWDGNFEGRQLPANDYWFVIQLDNGRIIKGHFSLMR